MKPTIIKKIQGVFKELKEDLKNEEIEKNVAFKQIESLKEEFSEVFSDWIKKEKEKFPEMKT